MGYFILFAIVAVVFLGGLHFALYRTLTVVFPTAGPTVAFLQRFLPAVLTILFIIASMVASRYYNVFSKVFYTVTASWIALATYIFLASIIFLIFAPIFRHYGSAEGLIDFGRILLAVALVVGVYGVIHVEKTKVTIINQPVVDMPSSWQGKKAVWISDIHLGQVHGKEFMAETVDKIKQINSDIVFIGGDLYDGVAVNVDDIISPLSELHPPMGMYFITGNHEEFGSPDKYIAAVKKIGIKVLRNESATVNGVKIIGVDYKDSEDRVAYNDILSKFAVDSTPSILLKHAPTLTDITQKYPISLQISGHTHRAQMFPLNIVTHFVYHGLDYGLHKIGQTTLFTSDGVGTWGPPSRVLTNSEIVEIVF